MSTVKNIPLKDFKRFLIHAGCKLARTSGGHEIYSKPGLLRPIVVQSHITPIPIHIVKSNLRTLGLSIDNLIDFLKNN